MSVISSMVVALSADTARFDKGMKKAQSSLSGLRQSIKNISQIAIGNVLANGISSVVGALKQIPSAMLSTNASFESATVTLEVLLGSVDAAKQRIMDLQKFSASTPFELPGILLTSKQLELANVPALKHMEVLRMTGDMAAAAGVDIGELGIWVSRAYAAIQGGKPWGESAMRLQELGVLSVDARARLEQLSKSGASSTEVWASFQAEMSRFGGMMDKQSRTFGGMMSTMRDSIAELMRIAGQPFFDLMKGILDSLLSVMPAFTAWVERNKLLVATLGVVVTVLGSVAATVLILGPVISALATAFGVLSTIAGVVVGVIGAITAPVWATAAAVAALIAGIAALVTWFFTSTEAGQGLASWIYDGAIAAFNALWTMLKDFGGWLSNTFGFLFEAAGSVALIAWRGVKLQFEIVWAILKTIGSWVYSALAPAFKFFGTAAHGYIKFLVRRVEDLAGALKWVLENLGLISKEAKKIPAVAEALPSVLPEAVTTHTSTNSPIIPTAAKTGADVLKSQFGEKAKADPKKDASAILDAMDLTNRLSGGPGAKSVTQFTNAADAFKDSFRTIPKAVKNLTDAQKAATKVDLTNKAFDLLNGISGGAVSQTAKREEQRNPLKPPEPTKLTGTTAAFSATSGEFLKDLAAGQAGELERRKAEKEAQKLRKMQANYLRDIAKNTSTGGVQLASIGGA